MKRFLFPSMLVAVIALVLYAPIRYNFIYPTGGDDTAFHIQSLIAISEDLTKIPSLHYYGLVSLLPFTLAGLDSITVFFWFNYIVLISIFVSLWFLLKHFYGLPAALLGFPLTAMLSRAIWHYFNDGTIFNIANLYIFGILAITCVALWLKSGSSKYLILSGVLFSITAVYHSVTYLFILASMGLFFTGFLVYKLINRQSYARLIYAAGLFCLSIPLAYFTWFGGSFPEERMAQMSRGEFVVMTPPVSLTGSITDYLSTTSIVAILFILGILSVIHLYRRGTKLYRKDLTDKLNQPLTYILLSFLVVFAIGTFTPLGIHSERFMRELSSFVAIFASVLLGITFTNMWKYRGELRDLYPGIYRTIPSMILVVALIGIPAGIVVSAGEWTSNYSAIKPIDIKAINFLNTLEGEAEVLVSPQIAYWIYGLYIKDNINLTHNVNSQPDYVVTRSEDMTWGTSVHNIFWDTVKLRKDWADHKRDNLTENPIVVYKDKGVIIKIWELQNGTIQTEEPAAPGEAFVSTLYKRNAIR
ncbi:hypothetical protein M1N82_01050 [Dehalococcoidia bacterium]|nr:hypothetical protein [Dehalococcoidia bacterium]